MRLLPLVFTAAAAVYAASDSDVETEITTSLGMIQKLTMNATAEIQKFDGSSLAGALPINAATASLVTYLQNATMDLRNNPENLTNAGAQAIGPNTQVLSYAVNASIATLIQKKEAFGKLKLLSLVVTSLQQQASASNNFSALVLGKIPTGLQPFAVAINSQLSDSIQQGIDCFSGKNETCNPNIVNASRTLDAAEDSGAIPSSAGEKTANLAGWSLVLGAAFVAFAVGV